MKNNDTQIENTDHLKVIDFTEEKLDQMKQDLSGMIDVMAQNSSLLSRASTFWGQRPWWQKVLIGSAVIIPLAIVSIVTQLAIFITITVFTLMISVAGSFLLDNHYHQNKENHDNLKNGLHHLADTLGGVIHLLDKLHQDLTSEITKLQHENANLANSVDHLNGELKTFSIKVNSLVDVEQQLSLTKTALEQTSSEFAAAVNDHAKQLDQIQTELKQAVNNYDIAQIQLAEKITELHDVKVKMGLQLKQAKTVSLTLRGAIETLTNTVITDKEQQTECIKRLQDFLENKEKSFDQIVDRICEAEHKLHLLQEELRLSNERYEKLLQRHEGQLDRIEQTFIPAKTLPKIGLFVERDQTNPIATIKDENQADYQAAI